VGFDHMSGLASSPLATQEILRHNAP
jgi:hypothetical protein